MLKVVEGLFEIEVYSICWGDASIIHILHATELPVGIPLICFGWATLKFFVDIDERLCWVRFDLT